MTARKNTSPKNFSPIDVAAAVVISDGKILLARRTGGYLDGLWEFPGGKLEAEESAAEAVKRELHEELSINVTPHEKILVLEHQYPDKSVRLHFIRCSLSSMNSAPTSVLSVNPEACWFEPEKIPLCDLCPADRIAAGLLPWNNLRGKAAPA